MKLSSLVSALLILAVCAGAAQAQPTPTHNPRHFNNQLARSRAMNEPARPVAYSKLDAYEKASPSQRARGIWGLDTPSAASSAPPAATDQN